MLALVKNQRFGVKARGEEQRQPSKHFLTQKRHNQQKKYEQEIHVKHITNNIGVQ